MGIQAINALDDHIFRPQGGAPLISVIQLHNIAQSFSKSVNDK